MPSYIYCNEDDSATMRGRIPAHDIQRYRKLLFDSLIVKRRRQLLRRNMRGNSNNTLIKRSSIIIDTFLFEALYYHHYSYDNKIRPRAHHKLPPFTKSDLFNQISAHDFYHVCGFWPE